MGKHNGEVTYFSIDQLFTTRPPSASKDGTVQIWDNLFDADKIVCCVEIKYMQDYCVV
jgi:hypothetical protein